MLKKDMEILIEDLKNELYTANTVDNLRQEQVTKMNVEILNARDKIKNLKSIVEESQEEELEERVEDLESSNRALELMLEEEMVESKKLKCYIEITHKLREQMGLDDNDT